jgi:hypothetical protein
MRRPDFASRQSQAEGRGLPAFEANLSIPDQIIAVVIGEPVVFGASRRTSLAGSVRRVWVGGKVEADTPKVRDQRSWAKRKRQPRTRTIQHFAFPARR